VTTKWLETSGFAFSSKWQLVDAYCFTSKKKFLCIQKHPEIRDRPGFDKRMDLKSPLLVRCRRRTSKHDTSWGNPGADARASSRPQDGRRVRARYVAAPWPRHAPSKPASSRCRALRHGLVEGKSASKQVEPNQQEGRRSRARTHGRTSARRRRAGKRGRTVIDTLLS